MTRGQVRSTQTIGSMPNATLALHNARALAAATCASEHTHDAPTAQCVSWCKASDSHCAHRPSPLPRVSIHLDRLRLCVLRRLVVQVRVVRILPEKSGLGGACGRCSAESSTSRAPAAPKAVIVGCLFSVQFN